MTIAEWGQNKIARLILAAALVLGAVLFVIGTRGESHATSTSYVVRRGNQHYAVLYEGLDPVTGRERRRLLKRPSVLSR